jgi:hypothetical protein
MNKVVSNQVPVGGGMNTPNDGGAAFPSPGVVMHESTDRGLQEYQQGVYAGMTLRDYFAAKALSGFCANPSIFAPNPVNGWSLVNCKNEDLADYAYVMADAMLATRDK